MPEFTHALEAYQRLDPSGWVALYRVVPVWLGIALALLGAFLLLFGGGRAFRILAGPLGAMVGFFFAPVLARKLQLGVPPGQLALGAAAALGVLGLVAPPGALFFAVGLPVGMLAGQLAGSADWWLGFAPGFLVGGVTGALLHRNLASIVSSAVGAWVLVIGLLAALHQVRGISQTMAANPWAVVAAAGFFALAGAVFQFSRPTPEVSAKLKQERFQKKKRAAEQKALEKRWSGYSTDRNK